MTELKWDEITLLYAEGDSVARGMISEQLYRRYPGVRIVQASNGAEGLAAYRSQHPDLVLTDLTMPVMDGIAMSEEIKAIDPDAVIIALTAWSDTEYLLKAIDVGINGYLLKPIVYEKLFALLDRKFSYLFMKKELTRKNEYVRKLSWAVERSPVSVVITDAEGRIEYVNQQFQHLTGYSAEEVVGQNVRLQKSGETPPETYRALWSALKEGKVWQGEFLNKKKNGNLYWEHAAVSPIRDDAGAITHYVAVKEDITRHKEMLRAIRKSQRKFSTLFQAVPALILLTTVEDCTVVEVNDNFLNTMGYRRDELVGRRVSELDVWESLAERERLAREVRQENEVRNLEVRLRGRSGRTVVGLLSVVTIEVDERPLLMGVVRDITERKEREAEIVLLNERLAARAAELESANAELEAFNSMIAHDLRAPLNVINSYSQVIGEMCGDQLDPVCREYLGETYNGTLRMNELIEALLNFSRLAHTVPVRQAVDLSDLAASVFAELRYQMPGCAASFDIAPGITARCDSSLLRIVMHNLLGNALKYNCKSADLRLVFGVSHEEGRAVYWVRDNGIGFDREEGDKIFRPFHRLGGAHEVQGHGIGLATVERIVKRHGGRVWAEGEAGKGAVFFFTLEPD